MVSLKSIERETMITEMNSQAISKMSEGRKYEASLLFYEALRLLATNRPVDDFDSNALSTTLMYLQHEMLQGTKRLAEGTIVAKNSTSGIYSNALLFTSSLSNDVQYCAAVLLFNFALLYHLEGVETGKSFICQHALSIYIQSYNLIGKHTLEDFPKLILLAAALCHNMAAIYSDFRHPNETRYLRDVLRLMMRSRESVYFLQKDDYVFFHISLFCAVLDNFYIAPAA